MRRECLLHCAVESSSHARTRYLIFCACLSLQMHMMGLLDALMTCTDRIGHNTTEQYRTKRQGSGGSGGDRKGGIGGKEEVVESELRRQVCVK